MKTEVLLITPQQAGKWLETKGPNRKLSPRHVEYLANEIKMGRWNLTHQGIAFSDDGRLIDGQHRLAAIKASGMATNMMVTTGIEVGHFAIVDRGMPRNMAAITGIPDFFSQCYVFLLQIDHQNTGKPSPEDVWHLHEHLGADAEALRGASNTSTRYFSAAPIRTAAIIALGGGNRAYILNTYRDLVLQNLRSLPPVALAVVRAYNRDPKRNSNSGFSLRIETYFKARFMFSKENQQAEVIHIGDTLRERYLQEAKGIVESILNSDDSTLEAGKLARKLSEKEQQLKAAQSMLTKRIADDIRAEQTSLSMEAKS